MERNGTIVISSKDAPLGSSPGNARFPLDANNRGVNSISMVEYELVLDIPLINARNDTAVIETTSQSYPVTIPHGNYDTTTLGVAVVAALNALGLGAFSILFDPTTARYNLAGPVGFRFIRNPVLVGAWDWSCMMGFPQSGPILFSQQGGLVDLTYTDAVYIVSLEAHARANKRDFAAAGRLANVLGVVPMRSDGDPVGGLAAPVGGGIIRAGRIEYPKTIRYEAENALSQLDIRLYDDRGQPLPGDEPGVDGAPPVVSYRLTLQTT